jgi:hypothetical protein
MTVYFAFVIVIAPELHFSAQLGDSDTVKQNNAWLLLLRADCSQSVPDFRLLQDREASKILSLFWIFIAM